MEAGKDKSITRNGTQVSCFVLIYFFMVRTDEGEDNMTGEIIVEAMRGEAEERREKKEELREEKMP